MVFGQIKFESVSLCAVDEFYGSIFCLFKLLPFLLGTDLSNIPIIIADINDAESLIKMTSSAKVLINCCGPYCFYGEAVVKACIETGTHQVDICGETQYMEMINLKYSKLAQDKGVYIVQSCGYDCIPADLGVIHLQKKFNGTK